MTGSTTVQLARLTKGPFVATGLMLLLGCAAPAPDAGISAAASADKAQLMQRRRTSGSISYHAPTAKQFRTLRSLEPLWIAHPTWRPEDGHWDADNRAAAFEFARITRAVTLPLWFERDWSAAIEVAKDVGVPVCAQWSPYWGIFAGYYPRDEWLRPQKGPHSWLIDNGQLATQLDRLRSRLVESGVKLAVVMLDHETIKSPGYASEVGPTHIAAESEAELARLLRIADDLVRHYFPHAAIVWYGTPSSRYGQGEYGPAMDFYCPDLYRLWDPNDGPKRFYMSFGLAGRHYAPDGRAYPYQVPFVALGSAHAPGGGWQNQYDYPTYFSRLCGQFLRNDAETVDHVWIYPGLGRSPYFWKHFLAYCQGTVERESHAD